MQNSLKSRCYNLFVVLSEVNCDERKEILIMMYPIFFILMWVEDFFIISCFSGFAKETKCKLAFNLINIGCCIRYYRFLSNFQIKEGINAIIPSILCFIFLFLTIDLNLFEEEMDRLKRVVKTILLVINNKPQFLSGLAKYIADFSEGVEVNKEEVEEVGCDGAAVSLNAKTI